MRQIVWRRIVLRVGRAKTPNGAGREIPIPDDLARVLGVHMARLSAKVGELRPDVCLFPFGKGETTDPTRHVTDVKRGWDSLRKRAQESCRLHDLRHTYATQLAEAGVSESTMLALMGHMSRAMVERYSHIRLRAKHDAVANLTLRPIVQKRTAAPVEELPVDALPVEVPVVDASTVIH